MRRTPVYGYLFKITAKRAEASWIAYAPGVGGVYEEGPTQEEAIENAYRAACAILEARAVQGDWLTEDGPDLRVVRHLPSFSAVEQLEPTPDEYLATVPC